MSKTEEMASRVPPREAADSPRIDERYRIEKKLGRDVAIKVLASGLHGEEALRRFEQEARATCALNHANILDVHDIGTHEGNPYIVSELLHGITLRERLRQGPLPVKEASGYALQLAQGLSAAHEKGIVHRDLKPENLFITEEGRLKILDFGIAKLVAPSTAETGETLPSPEPHTQEGAILGTVGYMSPEQVRGQPADQRSDVFSFGAILYEMLAGRGPLDRDTAIETGYAILNDDPPPLSGDVPAILRRVVQRCLAKRPEDRFESAHQLVDVLALAAHERAPVQRRGAYRWALGVGAALVLVAGGVLEWRVRSHGEGAGRSIAVLPLVNLSRDPDQEYFADGLAEELLNLLAKVPGLHVAGRTSSFSFKGKNEDLRAIGQKLNVKTVLEGSVQRAGDRLRITTQLINAADGYHVWSETYDRKLTDVFAVQDEISRSVVAALKVQLLPERAAGLERPATNPDAYAQVLLGRHLIVRGSLQGYQLALAAFRKAVELDPKYAPAWAGVAIASFHVGEGVGWHLDSRENDFARTLAAADKAIELGPDLADGYAARGYVRVLKTTDWAGARADLARAIALSPGNAEAICSQGDLFATLGRLPEAIATLSRATELDPLSVQAWWRLAWYHLGAGHVEEAREIARRTLELFPEHSHAARTLGFALLLETRLDEAQAAFQRSSSEPFREMGTALVEHARGHARESQQALEHIIATSGKESTYQIAEIYAFRGERERAFEWLEQSLKLQDAGMRYLKHDPLLRTLRADPRYVTLLKKMNLPVD